MKLPKAIMVLTSLRLTVATLALSLVVVFLGTLAQEPLGQKIAVDRFFKSFFVDQVGMEAALNKTAQIFGASTDPIPPERILGDRRWPVFPGGYLLGVVLLANLGGAYVARFSLSWKKGGILLIHTGVLALLLGQLLTDLLSEESFIHMERGDRRGYSVSFDNNELVFLSRTSDATNQVVALSENLLRQTNTITTADLRGLTIVPRRYWPNAAPKSAKQFADWFAAQQAERFTGKERRKVQLERRGELNGGEKLELDELRGSLPELQQRQFFAQFFASDFYPGRATKETAAELRQLLADFKKRVEEAPLPRDNPGTFKPALVAMLDEWDALAGKYQVEVSTGRLGDFYKFVVPLPPALANDQRNIPAAVIEITTNDGNKSTWLVSAQAELTQPVGDGQWHLALRHTRHYTPHTLTLVDLQYQKYPGTEIPKNFESTVLLENPAGGKDAAEGVSLTKRISMNQPLRHGGLTYYQFQMNQNQLGSTSQTVLQVVRNPGWLTPYFGCLMVASGLLYQFLYHLVGFARRRGET